MTGDTCLFCQASLALVGRAHRCVPPVSHAIAPTMDNAAAVPRSSTYRYRNVEHRKAYMRLYMRHYRRKATLRRQAARNSSQDIAGVS